jgi:hypothetical protein
MNQFSDLLDIKFTILIEIVLDPIVQNGPPHVKVACNGTLLHDNELLDQHRYTATVDLMDRIEISVAMSNKRYSLERETAVVIKSLMIDGFELVPDWTHLAGYRNERNNTDPTSYLGFNGVWTLTISEPFYRWRHRVTGQGWLLEPTSISLDCVPSLASTKDDLIHTDVGNIAVGMDPVEGR